MPKFKTQEEFILEAKGVHGEKYDYSKTIYKSAKEYIIVGCYIHGNFKVQAGSHLKHGCNKCAIESRGERKSEYNRRTFVEAVTKIHPNLIFSKTVYNIAVEDVIYECPLHGEKSTKPYNLLKGHGCIDCSRGGIQKGLIEKKIKESIKIHGDFYDYNKVNFSLRQEDKQLLICPLHGEFKQAMASHSRGRGCPKCGRESTTKYHKENPVGWSKRNWKISAEKSKNFDSFKVYVIRCWNENEEFYKIGRTFQKLKDRFNSYKCLPYNWEEEEIYIFNCADQAYDYESELKRIFKQCKYVPEISFKGKEECFHFPSSKTCSNCGNIKKDLKLSDRIFNCEKCGLSIDRDLNAAINIKNTGLKIPEVPAEDTALVGSVKQEVNNLVT